MIAYYKVENISCLTFQQEIFILSLIAFMKYYTWPL